MIVYDITDKRTFEHVEKWLEDIKKTCDIDHLIIMLVGNKKDLKHIRCVETEDAQLFAEKNKLLYLETSACDSTNVKLAFETLIKSAVEVKTLQEMNDKLLGNVRLKSIQKKKGCCKVF